jgi:putative toxin-antitoxin system antitoxin component (TIGR02293 family)
MPNVTIGGDVCHEFVAPVRPFLVLRRSACDGAHDFVGCVLAICAYVKGISPKEAILTDSRALRADEISGIGGQTRRGLIEATRQGLPVSGIEELLNSGRLTLAEVDRIVLPRKTLSHRRKIGHLTPEQSDRLVRVVRILAAAEETFGSQDKASRWLRRPTKVLEGEAPLEMLDTTEGAREVEDLLHRIDHGLAV